MLFLKEKESALVGKGSRGSSLVKPDCFLFVYEATIISIIHKKK